MNIEEMRTIDAVKTYKELEEAKAEIERLRKANFQLREGAEEQRQRIKRLEEAGDELIEYLKHRIKTDHSNPIWHTASIKWGKVKNELNP